MFQPKIDRVSYGGAMIGQEEKDAINRVINDQGGRRWTIGPESEALEKELAQVTGMKRSVLTNSGSSALLVALTALKLPKHAKVIIPALNFPTAFNAILQCGYIPVVVDCDKESLNISLSSVYKAIIEHPDIQAVVAVDIAGNVVDLPELREIVGEKVKIILDNCDGYGSTLNKQFIDTYADMSCVSFHAAHIITMGEGGAVLTNDEELANRAFKIREWGRASGSDKLYIYEGLPSDYRERYVYEEIGYNIKPLELQCAMGRIQLKKLQSFKSARRENYNYLMHKFSYLPQFQLVNSVFASEPCWFSFPILCNGVERGKVMQTFEENNIECRTIFSGNILKHPAYKNVDRYVVGSLENSDYVMEHGMFLSCHPSIGKEQIDYIGKVAEMTNNFVRKNESSNK